MSGEKSLPSSPPPARKSNYEQLAAELAHNQDLEDSMETYTVDDAIEKIGLGKYQLAIMLVTGLCWTAESMEMLLLSFIKAPLQCQWNISDQQAAAITTSVGTGMLIGAVLWGWLGDVYGRRFAFLVSTAFTFVFGVLSALAQNYWMLVVARGIVGIGIGGVPISFSILMEFLPAKQRGSWGMALALFWSLGAVFESFVAMLVVPKLGWRWLIAISSIPLGLVLLSSFWMAESPRWLISKGSITKAKAALARVAVFNGKTLPDGELRQQVDAVGGGKFSQLFRRGARTLALKLWVMWFVCAFVYYGLVMLQPELISKENVGARCNYAKNECGALSKEGVCERNAICSWKKEGDNGTCHPSGTLQSEGKMDMCHRQLTRADYFSTLWASVGELPGVIAAFVLVDVIGRRPLIGYMFAGSGITFVLLLACIGRAAETVTFFAARAWSTGAFQAVFLYTSEIFPATVRASAMGISSSIARMGLILSPFVAQYLENINHPLAMWIYFGFSALGVVAVALVPIETTGRALLTSMDELIELLRSGRSIPDESSPEEVTFAKDPAVPSLVRLFRWNAKVDGASTS